MALSAVYQDPNNAYDGAGNRVRKHVGGSDCVRLWLFQLQNKAKAGNIFFEGKTIYSYGTHFPMAEILADGTILVNGDTYSVTTSSHQSSVRGAITGSGKRYFIVPFSALAGAEIKRDRIRMLDSEPDREIPYEADVKVYRDVERTRMVEGEWLSGKSGPDCPAGDCEVSVNSYSDIHYHRYSPAVPRVYTDKEWTGEWTKETRYNHLMGASVFAVDGTRRVRDERCEGYEKTSGDGWRGYFVPEKCPSPEWYAHDYEDDGWPHHFHDEPTVRYFIAGVDETGTRPHEAFFLTELTQPVATVEDAYEALKPELVKEYERQDIGGPGFKSEQVIRQGEWFFIPLLDRTLPPDTDDVTRMDAARQKRIRKLELAQKKNPERLPEFKDWNDRNTPRFMDQVLQSEQTATRQGRTQSPAHWASAVVIADGGIVYARGTIRHRRGDHKMVKLGDGKTFYRVVHNVQVRSWTIDGKVD